jgi:hypothetical protein
MSLIQLPSESHLFQYFADALVVVRSCFIISLLDAIMDADSSLLGKYIFPDGIVWT